MQRFAFAENDAGRARLMSFLNARVADMRTRLPRAFATAVPGNFEIKRMAPEVEPGAPGAYGGPGSIDGKVTGKFWINMLNMSVFTTYNTPTLTYHESLPGHVWQGEYTFKLPLCRSLLAFNAYSEGWALYAEQLADELGVYDDDPSVAWDTCSRSHFAPAGWWSTPACTPSAGRANRPSSGSRAPTARRSTRSAAKWIATAPGPGQACGYKVGHSEINRLRAKAQKALGKRFDFRKFNDAVVTGGGVPMLTLARTIERLIVDQR